MAKLIEISGHNPGREVPMGDSIIVGRDPGVGGVVITNREASRRHARVYRQGDQYYIEDLNSANGTFVDGVRQRLVAIEDGSELTIGRTTFRFSMMSEPQEDLRPIGPRGGYPVGPVRTGSQSNSRRERLASSGAIHSKPSVRSSQQQAIRRSNPVWSLTMDARSTGLRPQIDLDGEGLRRERFILNHLSEISRTIGSILHLPELVQEILTKLFELFPMAENVSIHLIEEDVLTPLEARTRDGGRIKPPPISQTISSMAQSDRQSILSTDAAEDERFVGKQSIILQRVHSFMCSPLLFQDAVLGILYVDTTDIGPRFTSDDLQLFTAVSAQLAVAVKNSQLMAQNIRNAQVRAHLSRYLPPDLVDQVINRQIDLNPGGRLYRGTVLFSDVVGFTPMAERLGPELLVQTLNRYFKYMVETTFLHSGSVNSFGGDSMMALWGVPVHSDHDELSAVTAGVEMQAAIFAFNLTWRDGGTHPLKVGIGINTGTFVVGNIGSDQHMQYTALGNEVNIAQRVESQAAGWQVFLAEPTYHDVAEVASVFALPPKSLKGVANPLPIYSVRAIRYQEDVICSIPAKIECGPGDSFPAMIVRWAPEENVIEIWAGQRMEAGHRADLVLNPLESPDHARTSIEVIRCEEHSEFPTDVDRHVWRISSRLTEDVPALLTPPFIQPPVAGREYLPRR